MNFSKSTSVFIAMLMFAMTTQAQVFFTEDFDGALPSDWTAQKIVGNNTADSNWFWTTMGPTGGFAISAITSTTAANGFMLFDSDSNCSGGQEVRLQTPVIDCSTRNVVFVKFQNRYREFDSAVFLDVSIDGGMTWTGTELFDAITNNAFSSADNPHTVNINVPEAANQANVKFGFRFQSIAGNGTAPGCGYAWMIDDVEISATDPRPRHDMQVNDNFFATAPNVITPKTQVEPFGFLADISNQGSTAQTGVNLNISIINTNGAVTVFTDDLDYGTIGVDSISENRSFANMFTPSGTTGVFQGVYTITADSTDLNPINDERTFDFAISENVFAKESGGTQAIYPAAGNWDAGEPRSWAYGNGYFVVNGGEFIRTVQFRLGNAAAVAGEKIRIVIYEWDDANADGQAGPDERGFPVVLTEYEIRGNEGTTLIEQEVFNLDEFSHQLKSNTQYLVMLEYRTDGSEEVQFVASSANDYSAMIFASEAAGAPRYANFLGINGDLDVEDYSSVGFGRDLAPVVRMTIGEAILSNTKDQLSADNTIKVSPNPATTFVNVALDMTKAIANGNLSVISATGQTVQTIKVNNTAKQTIQINTSNLASGTYLVRLETADGFLTSRFIKQ